MKRMQGILMLSLAALLTTGCVRRTLVDLVDTHYVRIYVDEELLNVTTGFYTPNAELVQPDPRYASPEIMRLMLCDPASDRVVAERYLRDQGRDERGRYFEGYIAAAPGDYHLLAYNFDTETTVVRNEQTYSAAEAYTNNITSYLLSQLPSRNRAGDIASDERIVYDPDHLFVTRCEGLHIPYRDRIDTLRTAEGDWFTARSIVKSYYLQIRVKGVQWISSSMALLSGLGGSAVMHSGDVRSDDPVTVYFDMLRTAAEGDDTAVLYVTFGTFGKLPDRQNELEITFDFQTIYGKAYTARLDITPVFATEDAIERQWLLIDRTIEIPAPPDSGGGLAPDVDDWEDISADIFI